MVRFVVMPFRLAVNATCFCYHSRRHSEQEAAAQAAMRATVASGGGSSRDPTAGTMAEAWGADVAVRRRRAADPTGKKLMPAVPL